jgi:uncharacterized membrane protein YheB (UPF0754 family)
MNNQTMIISNRITFWASMTFLMAAFTCGVLHRASSVELPVVITSWILPVFTAAAVGYLTNWLAIQLLFRPYRPVRWLGGIQGMIPKNQAILADTLANEIPANLMPAEQIGFQIRRKIREVMQDPELADRLHEMVKDYIRDERRKKELVRQISAFLDTASLTSLETGLTPSNVRRFYHTYGSRFVKGKVIRNKALRARILDELKEQIPGLVGEIRANMPVMLAEYMRDNPIKGAVLSVFTGANGENLPWRKLEHAIRNKLSEQEADQQVKKKLGDFESRLEGYLHSPELESDITALKHNDEIGNALTALRDNLAEKLLDYLEDELVWQLVREQILPGIRVFLQIQIRRNKDVIVAGLDLPGHIRKSILDLKPENIYELVDTVSHEELGMIQLLGFVLGGIAGFLLVFAQ